MLAGSRGQTTVPTRLIYYYSNEYNVCLARNFSEGICKGSNFHPSTELNLIHTDYFFDLKCYQVIVITLPSASLQFQNFQMSI